MENNTNQKSNIILPIIAAIVIIVILVLVVLKKDDQKIQPELLNQQTDQELTQAVKSDDTKSIINNLDSISVEESIDTDLIPVVDKELQKL